MRSIKAVFLKIGLAAALIVMLGFSNSALSQSPRPSLEYQIKASLIFNFLQFVEWPPDSWSADEHELRLCTIGEDRFKGALTTLQGEVVLGKHLIVVQLQAAEPAALTPCHALFIGALPREETRQILLSTAAQRILTIGEQENFLEWGGIINFLVLGDRIKFEINNAAAQRGRLSISSKLLRLAHSVRDGL